MCVNEASIKIKPSRPEGTKSSMSIAKRHRRRVMTLVNLNDREIKRFMEEAKYIIEVKVYTKGTPVTWSTTTVKIIECYPVLRYRLSLSRILRQPVSDLGIHQGKQARCGNMKHNIKLVNRTTDTLLEPLTYDTNTRRPAIKLGICTSTPQQNNGIAGRRK